MTLVSKVPPQVPGDPLKDVDVEYHRRNWWGRLRHRPLLLGLVAAVLLVGLAAGTYLFLRTTDQLPGQILMRRSAAAMEQLTATPEFDLDVVSPLRQHLTANLAIGSRLDDLVTFIRKSGAQEVSGASVYREAPSSPSMMIGAWRDIIQELGQRRVDVYALRDELGKHDRWLRGYLILRLLKIDAMARARAEAEIAQRRFRQHQNQTADGGVTSVATENFARQARATAKGIERLRQQVYAGSDPVLLAQYGVALDVAQRAVVRRFGVTREEFDAILYLADCTTSVRQQRAAERK